MVWRVEGEINVIVTKHGNGALFGGGGGFRKFKMAAADDAPTCFFVFLFTEVLSKIQTCIKLEKFMLVSYDIFLDFKKMFWLKLNETGSFYIYYCQAFTGYTNRIIYLYQRNIHKQT